MNNQYKSFHTICAVDWNGGNLFFQWILTLATYLNETFELPLIIILLGPKADFENQKNLNYPKNIKILKFSELNIREIMTLAPAECMVSNNTYLYLHGWDKFSRIFVQTHIFSIIKLFKNLNIYSDASKPIINLQNLDLFAYHKGFKFNKLTTLTFTEIDEQENLEYLLKKNKALKSSNFSKFFKTINHDLINPKLHLKACNLYFPKSKVFNKEHHIDKDSTLIVLRYWGMPGYKFESDDKTIEIILEQIKNIEEPSKNKKIYLKKESRLSKNIQDKLILKLNELYNLSIFDEEVKKYMDYFEFYDDSFGLEIILYNFPSLILNFKKIYVFDGSFCWFISKLPDNILEKFVCDIYIGSNNNLDHIKNSNPRAINYIREQSKAQIIPFKKDHRFKVSRVKHFDEEQELYKISNLITKSNS